MGSAGYHCSQKRVPAGESDRLVVLGRHSVGLFKIGRIELIVVQKKLIKLFIVNYSQEWREALE
jgi:hypothetical protein